jgi:hypothetical protein
MYRSDLTTYQIRNAPANSIYVWLCKDTSYVESIAAILGRTDIKFVDPGFLTSRLLGMGNVPHILVDHAASLSINQRATLRQAIARRLMQQRKENGQTK